MRNGDRFEDAVWQTFRHADRFDIAVPALYRELVRYATFAVNSHNTQPWIFRIDDGQPGFTPVAWRNPVPHDGSKGC